MTSILNLILTLPIMFNTLSVLAIPLSSYGVRSIGGLENQTTSFFGFQPSVPHAGVEDTHICVLACRSGDCPLYVKLDPGARRRMRTVSWWCSSRPPQQRLENTAESLFISLTTLPGRTYAARKDF